MTPLETWPLVVAVLITLLCGLYLWEIARSYRGRGGSQKFRVPGGLEGFANPTAALDLRVDDACYDEFYAKVYDQLVQPAARAAMETKVPLEWLTTQAKKPLGDIRVADIGCGTGLHVALFAKSGVRSVVGYDKSPAMIAEAKRRFTDESFVVGDATVATMATAGEFDLVTLNYFTLYLIPERTQLLKNIYLWLAPGGLFCVHIVNKHKFDPVLESASPYVAFSIQKYSEERVTTSRVAFEEFDYTGDFQLHGSRGMYEEVFTFKDEHGGHTRRHEQRVWMPNIEDIVDEIAAVGFKYVQHADLTPIGYEYMYLFLFTR